MSSSQKSDAAARRGRPAIADADGRKVAAVMETFWRRGYAATSIGDLAEATGTARASLYKLFGDKAGALAAALDHYAARYAARVDAILAETSDPAEAVRRSLSASVARLTDTAAPPGCLRCRATMEVAGADPDLDAALARAHVAFERDTARLLRADGRADGPETAALVSFLTAVTNGLVTMADAGRAAASLRQAADEASEHAARRLRR